MQLNLKKKSTLTLLRKVAKAVPIIIINFYVLADSMNTNGNIVFIFV